MQIQIVTNGRLSSVHVYPLKPNTHSRRVFKSMMTLLVKVERVAFKTKGEGWTMLNWGVVAIRKLSKRGILGWKTKRQNYWETSVRISREIDIPHGHRCVPGDFMSICVNDSDFRIFNTTSQSLQFRHAYWYFNHGLEAVSMYDNEFRFFTYFNAWHL